MRFKIRVLVILMAFLFLSAFSSSKNDNLKLWEIFGRYHEYEMQTYPEWATYDGDNRFDDRLTDQSDTGHQRNVESLIKFCSDIDKIDYQTLSDDNKINLDLFRQELETNISAAKFHLHYMPLNQLNGIQIDLPQITDAQPFKNVSDFHKYFLRLKAASVEIDHVIENMKKGIAAGQVLPAFIIEQALSQVDEIKNTPVKNSPFFMPLISDKNLLPEEKKTLESELSIILDKELKPAYGRLACFMKNDYLKNSRKDAGIWSVPDGEKYYQYEIKHYTSTNLTAEQIHNIGLAEVERIRKEMEKVKDEIGFKGTLDQFNNFLKTDPRFYYSNKADLLNGYRETLKKIDKKLPAFFGHLPNAKYEVKEIDEYMAKSAPQAYYYSAPEDRSRPGYFYANTYDLTARPKYTMTALSLHEAVPGHHLQISISQELDELPWFRKQLDETAFVEGWALYAESLGYELGLYEDKYQHYGALTYEIERACRLVVDTGLHYKKWTREQAYQFLRKNTPSSDLDVNAEIDRYVVWPGQALAYKIGELKIKELRHLAETTLGSKFDIREFHDTVLKNGAIPLSLLEIKIKEWIKSK